jgi:hypothetical protein
LFYVQLDEGVDAGDEVLVGADPRGVEAGRGHRVRPGHALVVRQATRSTRVDRTSQEAAAQACDPETSALFLDEHRDGERPRGRYAAFAEQVDRGKPRHDPQRAVERSAVRDRVKVAAGDDGARAGTAPPSPEVAVAIGHHVQSADRRVLDEPVAQLSIDRSP